MSSPEFHGEEITNPAQRKQVDDALAVIEAQFDHTAEGRRFAAQFKPVTPGPSTRITQFAADGDRISRLSRARDGLRVWGPGLATTAGFVTVTTAFDVPGPMAIYGAGLVGFGWWHCAGRPGPVDSVRLVAYSVTDHYRGLRARITRLAERRAAAEAKRTSYTVRTAQ